jgi:cytochrome d ubiquinol oxidase subunit I
LGAVLATDRRRNRPATRNGRYVFLFSGVRFPGIVLFGEKRLGKWGHWLAAFLVFLGSWLSGFFIIVTDAWMQHPVAYTVLPDGRFNVNSFWGLQTNPWALIQYAHTMSGAVIIGTFVMAGGGAFYLLQRQFTGYGLIFLRLGVICGVIACLFQVFPSGDLHGKYMARHQPVTTAAMEGLFKSQSGAPIVILGQPNEKQTRRPMSRTLIAGS